MHSERSSQARAPTTTQSPSSDNTTIRHRCYLCSRTYERHDHLARHLKSHDNERGYKCPECGKGFNRADLLNRHRAAHAKSTGGDAFRKRTPRACEPCIKAKTKCDDARPCKRCAARDIYCADNDGRSQQSQDDFSESVRPKSSVSFSNMNPAPRLPTPASIPRHSDDLFASNDSLISFQQVNAPDALATGIPMADFVYPDFFEQIMMPDMANMLPNEHLMMPPDISDFTQDINVDTLDFDFSFLASGLTRPSTPQGHREEVPTSTVSESSLHSDAHLRSEAFKKSPWSWNHWIPEKNHSAFTGQEEINVSGDRVNATDQHVSPGVKRSVHCDLDHEARDRMIRVVTKVAHSKLAIPSFPSLELLEDLIDIFLLQDSNAIDTFVHAPSFSSRNTRTELLLGMIAAGSRYIALAPVWKMGLVVQEVTRMALGEVFESDNSSTRELQAIQTYIMWLEVGIWSGFRRKTELASSFLQPAVTMLTWGNAFTRARYHNIEPVLSDTDQDLEEMWRVWLQQEGLKRLVLHTYLHDSQVSITHLKNRLISPSQMMLQVPATRDLWLAPNAHAWRSIYISRRPSPETNLPSMMEVFGDLSILDTLGDSLDKQLCILVACHALAHEVWQFRQQATLLCNWQSQGRRDRWLAHVNRQRDLVDDLSTISAYCEMNETVPELLFTVEFLTMLLHVSVEDIITFSGKSGEEEARKVYPRVRTWTQDAEARTAVLHAGQVLRLARTFEKTRLRDFYAVALYQASLTLWVYGMVTSNTARKSGEKTPTNGRGTPALATTTALDTASEVRVFLDETNSKASKTFKLLGQGAPGLSRGTLTPASSTPSRPQNSFCSLHDSRGVMAVSSEILKGNFPESRNGLPPLVENLVSLMGELGRLSGK